MLLEGQGRIKWQHHGEGVSAEQWLVRKPSFWGEKSKLRNILFSNLAVTLHLGVACFHVLNWTARVTVRESIKRAKCLMGDNNPTTEPSPQGTLVIFSSAEISMYRFKTTVSGILVQSEFKNRYLVFRGKNRVDENPDFFLSFFFKPPTFFKIPLIWGLSLPATKPASGFLSWKE